MQTNLQPKRLGKSAIAVSTRVQYHLSLQDVIWVSEALFCCSVCGTWFHASWGGCAAAISISHLGLVHSQTTQDGEYLQLVTGGHHSLQKVARAEAYSIQEVFCMKRQQLKVSV